MIRVGLSVLLFLSGSFASLDSKAEVQHLVSFDYSEVFSEIEKWTESKAPEEILVVFDIDETLMVVEDCLPPGESRGFAGWLKKVFNCEAQITEDLLDEKIRELQTQGFSTMALTARAHNLVEPTKRELNRLEIDFLGTPFTSDDNFEDRFTQRSKVVFEDGVVYASGRNKGETLKLFQSRLNKPYKWVVFIDDSSKNIRAMDRAYREDSSTLVWIVHYRRYDH